MVPAELRYSKDHEWVRVEGGAATIGITDHAQSALGDIVFVEMPEVGKSFSAGETFGVIESVKAASDCFMPVSGKIAAVNESLADSPQNVNSDPYGEGWLIKVDLSDTAEVDGLMDAAAYEALLKEEG
ncbi:MAG: glycine cleavage system protein GcvH [Planctomycetota bacterium]|jgi:glycine cleavage system H protein